MTNREAFSNYMWPLLLAVAFSLFACLVGFVWFDSPISGDEPHYLVTASGIIDFHSLEQTEAYRQEFQRRDIYPRGLAAADAQPEESNTDAVLGPNGLYSIHNVGLPLLVAPAYALAGSVGAKLALVLMFSLALPALWWFARRFSQDSWVVVPALVATIFAFPFASAASQIYPDLPTGLILLLSVCWFIYQKDVRSSWLADTLVLITIAFLPWLHLKNAAPALIVTLALMMVAWSHCGWRVSLLRGLPLLLSILLLACYNQYAFGNSLGPYSHSTSLEWSSNSLLVFLGLHLDQLHGTFLQNPIYFVGLLYVVPFFRWDWRVAILCLLLYSALIVPNAMHITAPFGGDAIAGRFAWAAACIFLFPTLFGLTRLAQSGRRPFFIVIGLALLLQLWFYLQFSRTGASALYLNDVQVWIESSRSFYAPLQRFMPAFYNPAWAYGYVTNYAYVVFFIGVGLMGYFHQTLSNLDFTRLLTVFITTALAFLLTISVVASYGHRRENYVTEDSWRFRGADLPTQSGIVQGAAMTADPSTENRRHLTFGPYLELPPGNYAFEIEYSSPQIRDNTLGVWDVAFYQNGAQQTLHSGLIPGTAGKREIIRGTFVWRRETQSPEQVPSVSALPPRLEVRTYYYGRGGLTIYAVSLHKIRYL